MTKYAKKPLGQLQPGDVMFERTRAGKMIPLGTVESIEKKPARRSVSVSLVGGGGWAQNWAAKVYVKS